MLFAALALAAAPTAWTLPSPSSRVAIDLSLSPEGKLSYRVALGEKAARMEVVASSSLGLRREDQSFAEGLTFVSASEARTVDDRYTLLHGKRREIASRAREQALLFRGKGGGQIELQLRAYDGGVGFRYRFPGDGMHEVLDEATSFHIPALARAFLHPHSDPSQYGPAYEDIWREVASGTPSPQKAGWSFPALFDVGGGKAWVLLTETALNEAYCGSRLAQDATGGVYRLRFPDSGEGEGIGAVTPKHTLPWTMPWRVIAVGRSAGEILETTLVTDMAEPSVLDDDSWIKPGRASWSWWSDSDSPKDATKQKAYVDFSAEMGWEYVLVDANWNAMKNGSVEDVLEYAREKGVGALLWYNSGGPHNKVPEMPRDRMLDRQLRRQELKWLRDQKVAGIKVDFWHSDKQDRIEQYIRLLQDTGRAQILTNFHGCTIPRGWERTFPHLVSMEAVQGAEQYKFNKDFPVKAAAHNTILPFTRNAIGPMDYTVSTFGDAAYKHLTTNGHELAMAVVFESGIQHFADSAASYRELPSEPREFLKAVPVTWEETRCLEGDPGKKVVVARRGKDGWYVGGMSGLETESRARVSLAFIGDGTYRMIEIADGTDDRSFRSTTRSVTANDVVDVTMRPRGGFVLRLIR